MAPPSADESLSTHTTNSRRRRYHPTDDAIAAAEAAAMSINGIYHLNERHQQNSTPSKNAASSRRRNGAAPFNINGSASKKIPVYKVLSALLLFPLVILMFAISSSMEPHRVHDMNMDNGGVVYYPPKHTHLHQIPPILVFTYHTNLLTTPEDQLADEEDRALSQNVQHIVSLHHESTVRFLNDEDCKASIRATLGQDTKLLEYFDKETHGMYKADICRGAALYETGGLYFDIDIEARIPMWHVIQQKTDFVSVLVHKDSNHHGGFFQAFIGVVPKHKVMKRYVELFVDYYEGKVTVNGPLGVYFLRMAYDELNDQEKLNTELWKEVRYHEKLFPKLKDPPMGKRRACQMLVVSFPKNKKKEDVKIPFYSHARGSRMCGGKDTDKKGGTHD